MSMRRRCLRAGVSVGALGVLAALTAANPPLASADEPDDEVPSVSAADREAFQAESAKIAENFQSSPPPADAPDLDPGSTVDPHPELTAVKDAIMALAPGVFGGAYVEDGVVHLGIKGVPGPLIGLIRAQVPGVTIRPFAARYSLAELRAVTEEITQLMMSNPAAPIISAGPNVAENTVDVGVQDTSSMAAQSLRAKYGSLVTISQEEQPELRAMPGRSRFRNPAFGGLDIYTRNARCTAGFGYGPPLRQDPAGLGPERGIITAGHCFENNVTTQEWSQGLRTLGTFSRTRFVNGSSADAGTITTVLPVFVFRRVNNAVFVAQGSTPIRIKGRFRTNSVVNGDSISVSGAQSGFGSGVVDTGGDGDSYVFRRPGGRIITIRNVHSADVSEPIVDGDSGAPVMGNRANGDFVATGIVLGSQRVNKRRMFYSQIGHVERALGVTTCTGRPDEC